jgi:hypothetical protein
MQLGELLELCKTQMRAYTARDGKLIFDTNRNKREYVERFADCAVLAIWAEVSSKKMGGYTQVIMQHVSVYLEGRRVNEIISGEKVE